METVVFILLIILVGGFFGRWQESWTDNRIRKELDRRERVRRALGKTHRHQRHPTVVSDLPCVRQSHNFRQRCIETGLGGR
jgi:hypothetical protein